MMKTYSNLSISIAFILLLSHVTIGVKDGSDTGRKSKLPKDIGDRIDSFARNFVECSSLVGLNLAVVQDGQTIFSNAYGLKDLETEEPVTRRTMYSIGSITKSMTAIILGKILHERGLSWDTPVREILSDQEFQFICPQLTCQMTLKDLAAHRTGVASKNYAVFQDITRKQLVENLRFSSRSGEPRDGFTYNNNIYGVLAYIIEKLSGKTFEEMAKQEIFTPLDMNNTHFMHQIDLNDENLAQAYQADPENGDRPRPVPKIIPMRVDSVGAGTGSVVSTAEDMAQYVKLHMGLGEVGGQRIFPEDVIEESHRRFNGRTTSTRSLISRPVFPETSDIWGYGLGSSPGSYRSLRKIQFTGTLLGYVSIAAYLSEMNIGVYWHGVGANELEVLLKRSLLNMYVLDLLLGVEPWLNETTACTFPDPWLSRDVSDFAKDFGMAAPPKGGKTVDTKSCPPETDMKIDDIRYTGQYGNFQYGNVSVTTDETSGGLRLIYGFAQWDLRPVSGSIFTGIPNDSSFPLRLQLTEFQNFNEETGSFQEVLIAIADISRNLFQRDLKMSDAPPLGSVSCDDCDCE